MNNTLQKSIDEFAGKNFSEFKEKLSDVIVNEINPISLRIKELLDDKVFLEKILKDGYEKANEIASKKIKKFTKLWVFENIFIKQYHFFKYCLYIIYVRSN